MDSSKLCPWVVQLLRQVADGFLFLSALSHFLCNFTIAALPAHLAKFTVRGLYRVKISHREFPGPSCLTIMRMEGWGLSLVVSYASVS